MRWELLPGKSSSCLVMRPWTDSEKTPWAGRSPRSFSFSNQRCYATLKGAEGDLEDLRLHEAPSKESTSSWRTDDDPVAIWVPRHPPTRPQSQLCFAR